MSFFRDRAKILHDDGAKRRSISMIGLARHAIRQEAVGMDRAIQRRSFTSLRRPVFQMVGPPCLVSAYRPIGLGAPPLVDSR